MWLQLPVHGPKIAIINKTTTILGTNTRVISCIWVVACKILINNQLAKLPNIGAATNSTR